MPSLVQLINGYVPAPDNSGPEFTKVDDNGSFLGDIDLYNKAKTEGALIQNRLKAAANDPRVLEMFLEQLLLNRGYERMPVDQGKPLINLPTGVKGFLGTQIGQIIDEINSIADQFIDPGDRGRYLNLGEKSKDILREYMARKSLNYGFWEAPNNRPVLTSTKNTDLVGGETPTGALVSGASDVVGKTTAFPASQWINQSAVPEEKKAKDAQKVFSVINSDMLSEDMYGWVDGTIQYSSVEDVFQAFPFKGYKTMKGFVPDSTHLWDIQIQPHRHASDDQWSLTPDLPRYQKIRAQGGNSGEEFNYAEWMPVLSYRYSEGSMQSKELNLFNGETVGFPTGFTFANNFAVSILEDENKSMTNYMTKYISAIYDPVTFAVADYKNACFDITMWMYSYERRINTKFTMIGFIYGYESTYEGTEDFGVNTVNLDFKIVGMKLDTTSKSTKRIRLGNKKVSEIQQIAATALNEPIRGAF